ncbi:unnamed protein product, partial [Porites lobata]
PSRAPTNVRVENHGLNEFLVIWDVLPVQYANGRLLGYNVYYRSRQYYYYSDTIVRVNNTNLPQAILLNVQVGESYQISVAAFTSVGTGPRSPLLYVTKDCEGSVNQSFGWLNFTHTTSNSLNCSVQMNNAGAIQGVALVSFKYISLRYCSEFIKIYDNTGNEIFRRRGCDSSSSGQSVEVPFGDGGSITLAVAFSTRYGYARIQYTVLDKALDSVPSVAPSGLRVSTLHFSELKVQWNQIPEHSVNGRLLGYVVIYEEYPYYRYNRKRVNTSSPDVHMLVLSGLKAAHSYRFCVAGFTRTGTGPLTPFYYVTTGCGGYTNRSFGRLETGSNRGSSYITCTLVVGRGGINQAVALVWIQDLYLSYYSEYVKVTDGNGSLVWHKYGYPYSPVLGSFVQVGFGHADNITVQIHLRGSYSRFKLQYGIVKQGLFSVPSRAPSNVRVSNVRFDQVKVQWYPIPHQFANGRLLGYTVYYYEYYNSYLRKSASTSNPYTNMVILRGLKAATRYQIAVAAFTSKGPGTQSYWQSITTAFPLANWSVSSDNATATSIRFSWQNLQSLVGQQLSHYFIVVKDSYGSRVNEYIVSGNTTSHVLSGLSAWREYRLSIVGVNYRGNAYNSTEITAWTDEGVPSTAPSYIRLSNLHLAEVKVQWNPLSQYYANGRLLGYRVYFREYRSYYYYYSYLTSSVNTSSANVTMVILRDLKQATTYQIAVAAFTSKGEGPRSYWMSITT